MKNQWSDDDAGMFLKRYGRRFGKDLAIRTYSSRLLGLETALVLHGGGNTSVKTTARDVFAEKRNVLYVKASGVDLRDIGPEGHTGLDLAYLLRFHQLRELPDETLINEFRTHLLDAGAATPSLETLMHAFIPYKYVDHTHPEAFLALTNLRGGRRRVVEFFGDRLTVIPYMTPGFALAQAVFGAFRRNPAADGLLILHHGLVTWGKTAAESYGKTIEIVSAAERLIRRNSHKRRPRPSRVSFEEARERYTSVAPMLRGVLAVPSGDMDRPFENVILRPLITREVLDFLSSRGARERVLSPPLTTDYLVRTKAYPMWLELPEGPAGKIEDVLLDAIEKYARQYIQYLSRHAAKMEEGLDVFDSRPRVIFIPGVGGVCAGRDARAAGIALDITEQSVRVKSRIADMGVYQGLAEPDLFAMEYRAYQHAKVGTAADPFLSRRVALVTGAAGAIGYGICRRLLEAGCHVAATDLSGKALSSMGEELSASYPGKLLTISMDVTDAESVKRGFGSAILEWGGVDLVIVNAGLAHVATLSELRPGDFRRLERVNAEGTLNVLTAAGNHFRIQKTGGDIVLISTKNVFAPGASFGAYSATKAAAHQLARIASLELAGIGVRVNMVAPDAVFSEGARKSGLWQEVGPARMRARGLDEKGLEAYYCERNLLKSRVTAGHVAAAVLFLARRETPTTGATIPVDGGLPDATPR